MGRFIELWEGCGAGWKTDAVGEETRRHEGNWVGMVTRMKERWNQKIEESGGGEKT